MRKIVLVVLAATALAGCGGSDGDGESAPRADRPAAGGRAGSGEFVRRIDALCRETRPQLAEIRTALTTARDAARAGRAGAPKTFETFVVLLRRAGAILGRFEARLRAIEPPRAERRFHAALVESVEEGTSNLRRQVSAAERQDAIELRRLSIEGSVIDARQKGLMTGHGGFRFCARG